MNNHILLVDDSELDRSMIAKALRRKGNFQVTEAKDGAECLELLKLHKFDLVLMDIMMPNIFGDQILKTIRDEYNTIELPIIMVTAIADSEEIVKCLRNGANDYIIKPVNFDVSICRISTHLKLSDLSREMSRLKQVEALNALVTTYNHEINNPLAVAIACLDNKLGDPEENAQTLKTSLWRIAEVVKKISSINYNRELQYEKYVGSNKMVKIK